MTRDGAKPWRIELLEQAAEVGGVCYRGAGRSEPSFDGASKMRHLVDGAEDFVGRLVGDVGGDANRAQLEQHPGTAARFHDGLGPRGGHGNPAIVDGAYVAQPGDGRLDGIRLVLLARQPLTQLCLGQLSARQHRERRAVGRADGIGHG